ncbi:right-handed parallel beta-helix repeat-containing protein, partial [Pseudonocardia pini]|uniref:right-handed parallel beta-helix repeat-containing protein n=1 Tax=Pseudonocardia pini TaxID=2758030 RepID=UPI0015F020E9
DLVGEVVVPVLAQPVPIDAHPAGTTYCFAAGVHRLTTPLVPKAGDALVGERGSVLSGSVVLTGWARTGKGWSAAGRLPPGPSESGECLETAPLCTATEDVFLDGRRLTRVGSAAAVGPGAVYADYATGRILVGDDPTGRLVEQAVAPGLVAALVDDVTVANLVLEQAANEGQVAAVEAREVGGERFGSGWTIRDNEVRSNHAVGIGFASHSVLSGNLVHDQGQLGFGAWGSGSVVRDNVLTGNGAAGYSFEWEAGGGKSWMTEDLTIEHNLVQDNRGPGLWTDGGNIRTTYAFNIVADNDGAGIQHEISYDALVTGNEISRNGRVHKGWAWEAGIQIQSSGGIGGRIEVVGNRVTGGPNGITLIEGGDRADEWPAPFGPHLVRNVWVHDNVVVVAPGGTSGAVEDIDDPTVFAGGNNRFEANTYYVPSLDGEHFVWDGTEMPWSVWRGSGGGNDLTGRVLTITG